MTIGKELLIFKSPTNNVSTN